jgi:hypothetical protein
MVLKNDFSYKDDRSWVRTDPVCGYYDQKAARENTADAPLQRGKVS